VVRLRRVDCSGPGIRRIGRGRGFSYLAPDGRRITDHETLTRIDGLVIPPAWRDVWICPIPNGHIQATGTDAAGRRQYRYHDAWREARDKEKHERMLVFAASLPAAREQIAVDLARPEVDKRRVLAAATRLLDLGFFRIGSEEYAETNHSYGLATLLREHVALETGVVRFDYIAKSGKHRVQSVVDSEIYELLGRLKRRRGGGPELLAYRDGRAWRDVKSHEINEYVQEVTGGDFTAKDFRTWHATVLCAVSLAVVSIGGQSEASRKRAVSFAVKETSGYLGNTPTVCRASYIDPRVIDLYNDGVTIADDLDALGAETQFGELATRGAIEQAVLDLLREPSAKRHVRTRTARTGPARRPSRRPAAPSRQRRAA
jgi:DNA topoisomerase IB